jgi:hypothetical protein
MGNAHGGRNMQISAIGTSTYPGPQGTGPSVSVRQAFENLGTAIESGNLDDAKNALSELQKNAPTGARNRSNPMSDKMAALTKAVDSGDLSAAKSAYADLKQAAARGPKGGGERPAGAGSAGGASTSGTKRSSSSDSTSSTNSTYDRADANQDGVVSMAERITYDLAHPEEAATKAAANSPLDTTA